MTSIIHISDPHFETWETMPRLNNLAYAHSECDVVAVTGDCTSKANTQLPAEWNVWPQPLKLCVPGNHDVDHTFDLLPDWYCHAPWITTLEGLCFVGLDSASGFLLTKYQLDLLKPRIGDCDAFVILSHRWPSHPNDERYIGSVLKQFVGNRPLLVLHGHEHPYPFTHLWEKRAKIADLRCYRSKVYSSARDRRGLAHILTWTQNHGFECALIQGDL